MSSTSGLIYDWNRADGPEWTCSVAPHLDDETLRDGLQSPSVLDPPIEDGPYARTLLAAAGRAGGRAVGRKQ